MGSAAARHLDRAEGARERVKFLQFIGSTVVREPNSRGSTRGYLYGRETLRASRGGPARAPVAAGAEGRKQFQNTSLFTIN